MDLYLCGTKGLAALNTAIRHSHQISKVFVQPDPGLLNDPYDLMLNLIRLNGLDLGTNKSSIDASEALAVGWKFLIEKPYLKLFVIHDSVLPKFRGWNPLVTALQNGEAEIGATLILADAHMDHGPILKQLSVEAKYPLKILDAMIAVEGIISDLTEFLFRNTDRNTIPMTVQQESMATYSIWRDEDDYRIDWRRPAEDILLFIDSVSYPYHGAKTTLNSRVIRVFEARLVEDIEVVNREPGKVWKISNGHPQVLCKIGLIEILKMSINNEDTTPFFLKSTKSRFI
jgi:methionyl-tRNA formyltransferase